MSKYGDITNPSVTPQNEAARLDQVKNNAGGFVFEAGPWKQLDRFLILGAVGPTYYASERKVVKENFDALKKCLTEDGLRVVKRVVEISDAGRAPKNDPAIFVLAVCAGDPSPLVRAAALEALPKVCRIGTHLFHFAEDVQKFRKWGRGLRHAVANWYLEKKPEELAMQAIKYQQRDGWSHRDLLRLSHPQTTSPNHLALFRWMTGGTEGFEKEHKRGVRPSRENLPRLVEVFEEMKLVKDAKTAARLIREHKLPRETVPTELLNNVEVWEALLPHMGATAMIRNLGKMTAIKLLGPMGDATKHVAKTLTDEGVIRKARVHPMQFLIAQGIYRQGHGDKGKLSWSPVREIGDALDSGFYTAFKTVEPTGKNTLLAIDVSGSMDGGMIAGAPGITPRIAAAAMAMVTARVEESWGIVGFTSSGRGGYGGKWGGQVSGLTPIDVSANDRLDTVIQKMQALPMGGTDCSLPMLYAAGENIPVDVFHVYTDNETWHGGIHPFQALKAFRDKTGRRDVKLIVAAFTPTNFTIADPSDPGMLDVVGFDSHAPALMADFARGNL